MNMMPRDPSPVDNRSDALFRLALCPELLLGMPHLTPFGLSRTWLLKELGHRHWILLARRLGLANADFRTPDNQEAYAAISALKVDARLSAACPNDILGLSSDLYAVSDARMESLHRLSVNGEPIGSVLLQSTFVARAAAENRSIRRSIIRHFQPETNHRPSQFAEDIQAIKEWREPQGAPIHQMTTRPCPFEEFNGAGLFYFAEFAALVTGVLCMREGSAAVRRLGAPFSMLFRGNIDAGDEVSVRLHLDSASSEFLNGTITRSDGSPLANFRTG
ncbi:Pnap_2097 family protein [Rhizobium sp. FKL33]|uniref:Pnap_2097 family protein n=1 Tax=Rhizobium sp. FKL33 TaxID=2562307 RepID=UPI0010C0833D|nr:Pnap_2097 family protein [Rhizobium sp. FKL33]